MMTSNFGSKILKQKLYCIFLQDEENLGIEQHFESKPLDDIYQEQKPKSCPARGYPATIVWVKKEDIGKDKGQHNKAQQERKKMPVRCPVKGCTAASRNLKLNHAYPAHIPKVFHQLEEEERSNNDIHRKRLNGLQTLAVNFRGEGSSIDDCVDYLNKNLSLVIVQLTEVLDPQQAEMKALCEFAGWPVPESKFRVYPDINSPACLLYWRILLFLIEQLPEPEKTEFYTLYPLIGKGFFRRGKNAVVKLDGVKKAEEKQDDVKKAEGKQDDVKEAEIKQDDVKKAEGKQDDVKKAEEKRDGVKKSEEKQDGVKKAEEKQDDEKV